ncbi:hypothetical protein [Methylobacterium platani]|uniref:hypothetical protein n=1 Tax=Methylobacterium platani TaxID=427683 RepID=UPI0012E15896|nr:hypothetical protein [Methylobacterium platani]
MASDPLRAIAIRPRSARRMGRSGRSTPRAIAKPPSPSRHRQTAFVMAWALLEAALRVARDEAMGADPPGTVVQALAMNGLPPCCEMGNEKPQR